LIVKRIVNCISVWRVIFVFNIVCNVDGLFSGAACESGSTFYFAKDGINEQSNKQSSNSVAKAGDEL